MKPFSCQCPHCKSRARARTSQQITPMYRETTFICTNHRCGHIFVCSTTPVRTLSPSSVPDPEVNIPLSSHIRRIDISHQLTMSLEVAANEHD